MKAGRIHLFIAASICVVVLALAGAGRASDIGDTVKQVCSRCHSTKRICLNVGVKSASAWKSTVTQMVGKGAQLPADKIEAAVGYLSGLAPGTGSVCQ